jgi:hypothetical protein
MTQKVRDSITFPLRAATLLYADRIRLPSLASQQFDHVAREVRGYCLDVGWGGRTSKPGRRSGVAVGKVGTATVSREELPAVLVGDWPSDQENRSQRSSLAKANS